MAYPILMPKAGQSMTEGKIVTWLKKEGDTVERGAPLLEIETDKANLDVEATEEGILRLIAHQEGETIPVLTVIGVIGEADEEIDLDGLRSKHEKPVEEAADTGSSPQTPASVPGEKPGTLKAAETKTEEKKTPAAQKDPAAASAAVTIPGVLPPSSVSLSELTARSCVADREKFRSYPLIPVSTARSTRTDAVLTLTGWRWRKETAASCVS